MLVVADVNGDGILDIVTANGYALSGSGVSVLLGNLNGTFQAAKTIVAGGNPSYLLVGDFNHDGKPDIAVANEPSPNLPLTPGTVGGPAPDSVSILRGNGNGTFQPSIDTPTVGALKIVAADFNGDGKVDLAVTTGESTPVQILLGHGDGHFTVSNTTVNALDGGIVTGDFNRDGKQDILAGGEELLGNGDGTFSLGPLPPGDSTVADINGDGAPDIIGEVASGKPVFFAGATSLGLPDGTWNPQFVLSNFTGFGNLVTADFNGDGKLDIFGPGSLFPIPSRQLLGGLFLGHGDGTFTQASFGIGSINNAVPVFAAAGDFDHNGAPDVAIANGNGVMVALNTFGHPALLAQVTANAGFVLGSAAPIAGTVSLGGPAPVGGAGVSLSSSSPSAFFPGGSTVTIPAGSQTETFNISTEAVAGTTPVTISASYHSVVQSASFTLVKPFSIASVFVTPVSLYGMFGGNPTTGTVTLSGLASAGVVVSLSSGDPSVLSVPATVSVPPGASTATFPLRAGRVQADTPVVVSGALKGITQHVTVTVRKETPTVAVTKAEYVVKKSLLTIEANSNDRVGSLQVFNPSTGAPIGSISLVNVGKFAGQLTVHGAFPSVALQSSVGGLAIAPVAQK